MKSLISILFVIISVNCSKAQNEGNIWYFGAMAGLDFNGGAPVVLTNSAMGAPAGCASISNHAGNILFYTNGSEVWNRNHAIMPNGSGLAGDWYSSQAAIIVKMPGLNTIYYVFTVDGYAGPDGLKYSEVDMSLQGGLGDVNPNKNIPVVAPTYEKVTGVKHQNGIDYWIVTHLADSGSFHSYLLTSTGLDMNPVVSSVGSFANFFNTWGHLKTSLDGSRIAMTNGGQMAAPALELFDFDNSTGLLSNIMNLSPGQGISSILVGNPYGVEFSPNGNILYVASGGQDFGPSVSFVFQFDLLAGSASSIQSSQLHLATEMNHSTGALQLAPDGKIYHATGSDSLESIISPNTLGIGCGYTSDYIYLDGKISAIGLPQYFEAEFINGFNHNNSCSGDSTLFSLISIYLDSVLWDFGDILSGPNNTSNHLSPAHLFTDTGIFFVTVFTYYEGHTDSISDSIFINPAIVESTQNETICSGDSLWFGGHYHNTPGEFLDTLESLAGCDSVITLVLLVIDSNAVEVTDDTLICQGDNITISALGGKSYLWENGETTSNINVSPAKDSSYIVTITNACGIQHETITVDVIANTFAQAEHNATFSWATVLCYKEVEGLLTVGIHR